MKFCHNETYLLSHIHLNESLFSALINRDFKFRHTELKILTLLENTYIYAELKV